MMRSQSLGFSPLLKMLANLWYLGRIIDKLTKLFIILAVFLARSVEQNMRQKVVNLIIHTTQIYNCEPIIIIWDYKRKGLSLGLKKSGY